MSNATPKLQIAWAGTGIVGAAGTDVTSRVRYEIGVAWSRGMDGARVFASPVSGELGFVLDNQSKDYSAEYASSPLYPNVVPGRKAILTTTSPARTLFTGHLKTILQQPAWGQKTVAFGCLDTLTRLGRKSVSTGVYENVLTGAAINAVLDAIGWPSNERVIDTGTVALQQWWLDKEDAAGAVVSLMLTEGPLARIYIDPRGYFVFEAQDYRTTESRCTSSQATFTSTTTNIFFSYEPNYDDIVSKIRLTQTERVLGALDVLWSYGADELVLTANQVLRLEVKGSAPFKGAILPQAFGTNAIQTLAPIIPLTSGTFTLTWNGETTSAIDYDATAAEIQTALEALTNIGSGNVICGGGPVNTSAVSVQFIGTLKEKPQPLFTYTSSLNVVSSPTTIDIVETVPIDVGVNQVFTLTPRDTLTGGIFRLKFGSVTTPTILFSASAANIQTACENTSLFNSGDVTAGGGPINNTAVTLEIIDVQIGSTPIGLPTVVSSSLVASRYKDALRITETQKGGGPDYVLTAGDVLFAFDRDNGGSITLSITAGASGATLTGLQVRAQQFAVARTTDVAYPTTDVLDPQGQVYSPNVRQEVSLTAMQALAQTYYDHDHVSVPAVVVTIATGMNDASACDAILAREVSDLITVVDLQTGVNQFYFIEGMNHAMQNNVLTSTFRGSLQGDAPVNFPSVSGVVRKWRGLISQGGGLDPTVVVLQNDLGGTIVWTADDLGQFRGTLADAFPDGRTLVFPNSVRDANSANVFSAVRENDNQILLTTGAQGGSYADAVLSGRPADLEIFVYSAPLVTVLPERQLFRGLILPPNTSDVPSAIELDNSYPSALVWNESDGNGDYQGDVDGGFGSGTELVFINSILDAISNDQVVANAVGHLFLLSGTVDLAADTGVIADVIPDRGVDLMLMRATDSDLNGTGEIAGVLVYRATLRQSGTAAPTVWELIENSLGVTPTFARTGAGQYTITATGKFASNKTFIKINGIRAVEDGSRASLWRVDNNTLALKTGSPAAGYFDGGASVFSDGLPIEIIVYP